jgi:hypothetical protein
MGDIRGKRLDKLEVSLEFTGHLFQRAGQIADFVSAADEAEPAAKSTPVIQDFPRLPA